MLRDRWRETGLLLKNINNISYLPLKKKDKNANQSLHKLASLHIVLQSRYVLLYCCLLQCWALLFACRVILSSLANNGVNRNWFCHLFQKSTRYTLPRVTKKRGRHFFYYNRCFCSKIISIKRCGKMVMPLKWSMGSVKVCRVFSLMASTLLLLCFALLCEHRTRLQRWCPLKWVANESF